MPPVPKLKRDRTATYLGAWRKKVGLNQTEAGDRVGLSQEQLSRIETGKGPYSQDVLELAAEAYGVDVVDLLKSNPDNPDDFWALLVRASRAAPAVRAQIAAYIRFALEQP